MRLESTEERPVDHLQVIDAVVVGLGGECFETREFRCGGRHNQLAAPLVRDMVVPAEAVQPIAPVDTETGLE